MKVLIVRLSAIGDVVHTLPVLAALHDAGHEASWLVEPASSILLQKQPWLAEVAVAPAARRFRLRTAVETVRALRAARYDVALDLQGLFKSAAWSRLAGARRVIGMDGPSRRESASALLMDQTVAVDSSAVHVIDRNLAVLRGIGIEASGRRQFPLPPSIEAADFVERELRKLEIRRFALLNPGGGWASKLWPAESYGRLARRLSDRGLRPLVAWGPGERPLAERVAAASEGAAVLSFPTTLLEFAELARRAQLTIAADTGPLHLACATSAPVVGLYGPTDPARNGPFSPEDVVIRHAPACAPCHRRGCPVHDGIMQSISVDEVERAVEQRLSRRESSVAVRA